ARSGPAALIPSGAAPQTPVTNEPQTCRCPAGRHEGPMPKLNSRQILVVVHDLVATAAAIVASFYLRFEAPGLVERLDGLLVVLPGFLVYAAVVYRLFELYKGKWRFASVPDLSNLFRRGTVLAVSLL